MSKAQFAAGPTAVYGQLAGVFRAKIRSGEWGNGSTLPTLEEISEQYNVARVTGRQAIQILVGEGLVSSQRGRRTTVTYDADSPAAASLFGNFPILDTAPSYSIRILSTKTVSRLPIASWYSGTVEGEFVCIRKVDSEKRHIYALSECYVDKAIYDRFPKGAINKAKIARLVVNHTENPVVAARERMRVGTADLDEATLLDCSISSPVVRIQRLLLDEQDNIAYYGNLIYRGDLYGHDRDISEYLK